MSLTDIIVTGMNITVMNATDSNIDPYFLPSAIMQTIATLYGIFIAIFVLVFQSFSKYRGDMEPKNLKKTKEEQEKFKKNFSSKIDSFKNLFVILAYFVIVFIIYNGILVYCFSYSKFNFYIPLFASFLFFIVLVAYIIGFSYYLISFIISLEVGEPDFKSREIFKRICNFDFYGVLVNITVFFFLITIFYYLAIVKNSIHDFIILSLISLAIIYSPHYIKKKNQTKYEQNAKTIRSEIDKLENSLQEIKCEIEKLKGSIQQIK
jgi:hypothetical protein